MDTRTITLFDCTLRDGGYYTDWDFGDALLERYLDAMRTAADIRSVEIGYRSPAKETYFGRFFHLPRSLAQHCRDRLRPDQRLAIMLNEKDVRPESVKGLIGDLAGVVNTIRFAVAPSKIGLAIELADACDELGFSVGLNIMYLNTYVRKAAMLAPLARAKTEAVALVDSYGGCMPDEVRDTVAEARAVLPHPIGFHGHDNIGLAFANSLAAIEGGATTLDTTVAGMGRGAGNAKTELALSYLAARCGSELDYSRLSAVVDLFVQMQKDYEWGTNLAYMISGFAGLPQADVMDWLGTRRYSLASIVAALRFQGGGEVDDKVYPALSDSPLRAELGGRPALVIGGGESVVEHVDALKTLAVGSNMTLVHSTTRRAALFDDLSVPQVYCLAGQELNRLSTDAERAILFRENRHVVTPEAPRLVGSAPHSANVYQVPHWVEENARERLGPVTDEPPLYLAFASTEAIDASDVYLAGFDGYRNASASQQANARDVQAALTLAETRWPHRSIVSVTPTSYNVACVSAYALSQTARTA
jgi:4-hydroxy 2-oxovalerate aldolase